MNLFSKWETDTFHAYYFDKGYKLWIANGFLFFRDDGGYGTKQFLQGMSLLARWKVWRELKREITERSEQRIKDLEDEF